MSFITMPRCEVTLIRTRNVGHAVRVEVCFFDDLHQEHEWYTINYPDEKHYRLMLLTSALANKLYVWLEAFPGEKLIDDVTLTDQSVSNWPWPRRGSDGSLEGAVESTKGDGEPV